MLLRDLAPLSVVQKPAGERIMSVIETQNGVSVLAAVPKESGDLHERQISRRVKILVRTLIFASNPLPSKRIPCFLGGHGI